MAFGRLERTTGPQPMSEINMTPLIDVMLVLLVIFIVTAPLMSSSLRLDLPRTDAATPGDALESVSVSLSPDGGLYWGEDRLAEAEFSRRMTEAARRNPDLEVQLRADQRVPYGRVATLIGTVQKAGLSRIAFVAEPDGAASTPSAP